MIEYVRENIGKGNEEVMMDYVGKEMREEKIKMREIESIEINIGKGQFKGVSIGVQEESGFEMEMGVKEIGIKDLEEIEDEIKEKMKEKKVIVMIDENRGEIYEKGLDEKGVEK